jgi:hypothetical protein
MLLVLWLFNLLTYENAGALLMGKDLKEMDWIKVFSHFSKIFALQNTICQARIGDLIN